MCKILYKNLDLKGRGIGGAPPPRPGEFPISLFWGPPGVRSAPSESIKHRCWDSPVVAVGSQTSNSAA